MLLLFVNSCKKDERYTTELANSALSQKLSNWYDANIKVSADNPFSEMKPKWNNIYTGKQLHQNVYEVKLSNPKRLLVVSGHVDVAKLASEEKKHDIRLLIFENTLTGKIS